MKKIIIGIFALIFSFSGAQSVFAYTPFNGQSGDCSPAIAIGVYGDIKRDSQGCWTERTVSADAGDIINIAMYYHNNTNSTLTNVSGSIVKSSSSYDDRFTFTGRMYSDQGSQTIGTVTLNLSSNQKLIYKSTHIMKGASAVINDRDTSVVYNDGGNIRIGSVAPGWNNYGEILVVYEVSDSDYDNNDDSSCTISNFTASDTSIDEGDSVTLRWNTNNCDRVKISDIGNVDDDGSDKVYPDETTTYTLTAYDDNGYTRTRTVRIYVDEDYYNNDNYCSIDSFTASDTSIDEGDYVTLKWRTTDCDDVSISGIGDVDEDGSKKVYPSSDRTYTLRAYGDNGSRTKSIKIYVDEDNNSNDDYDEVIIYNNDIVTTIATNVSETGAQLNGVITNSKSGSSDVYFNYGKTIGLESRTNSSKVSGNTNFSSYVTNLTPNTRYYFQAVSSNGDRGIVQIFKTPGYVNTTARTTGGTTKSTTTKNVITQGKTIVGANSPIVLKIENKYKAIGEGDEIDYTVYYKNISNLTLTNPMVQVYIPEGITLTDISNGTYSERDRTLSVPIDDLSPNEDGNIYLKATVDNIDSSVAQIVTTALLVYTSPNDTQENAMAYVLNTPKELNKSLLGASAFSSGFMGLGLIGWLFITIIILLLIIISRSFYGRKNENKV